MADSPYPEWLERALEAENHLMMLDQVPITTLSEASIEFLKGWGGSKEQRRSMRQLDRRVGKQVRAAAGLEHAVAMLLAALSQPENPLEYVDSILELTPFDRSNALRELIAPKRNEHWRTFINEVQASAEFRNKLAHGTVYPFNILERGELELGWFLKHVRKRKGVHVIETTKLTRQNLRFEWQKTEVLGDLAGHIRRFIFVYRAQTGTTVVPTNLRAEFDIFGHEDRDWARHMRDELFPELA
jgi:hypothetical protein